MQLILLNVRYHKIVFNLRFYGAKKEKTATTKVGNYITKIKT